MSEKRRYRCAIYTRKSHEEGLDQDFNSLDAQREACEAYILSQAGMGWELVEKSYDDGGISGGHMERSGLQVLLSDIKVGKIDVVVVYKVDRLTRSITDFGKLIEIFDEYDVSFMSVTQAFNTTNSMGRLTLNVLLSFAQFEREVTAERIRDKIASSKQKGMWMGGRVPYGYQSNDKKLVIDEKEADTVRSIFSLYRKEKNARLVKIALDRQGICTRTRVSNSGKRVGGTPFSIGHLYSILKNPIYAGKIKHKDNVYPGKHQSIIGEQDWDEVQSILANQSVAKKSRSNQQSPTLLNSLLFDDHGNRLVPHHTNKNGRRYYYYVNRPNDRKTLDRSSGGPRLPMKAIERTIKMLLIEALKDDVALLGQLDTEKLTAPQIKVLLGEARALADQISNASHADLKTIYNELIVRIVIGKDALVIKLKTRMLFAKLADEVPPENTIEIARPIEFKKRGQEMKLVIGELPAEPSNPDPALIKLIAKAHLLKTELESAEVNSIKEFAVKYELDHGDAKNLIPLCYLDPNIIEDILNGRQPAELTASRLRSANGLPVLWSDQRQQLRFAA